MENIYNKITKDVIFFDLETTGVDIKIDQIIEIYAVKYTTAREQKTLHKYIKPTIPISPGAFETHGISIESLESYPTMSECFDEIFDFFIGADLGGYNCLKFDIPFLFEELSRFGKILNMNVNVLDSYNLINKLEPRTLNDVYRGYFGEEIVNLHSSKDDTEATIRVFEKQLDKYGFGDKSMSDISNIVRSDKDGNRLVDLSGWFIKIGSEYYYNRGTNKESKVFDNLEYLKWMIGSNRVENNSRLVAEKLLALYAKL